ncbi:MAG: tetrahydrofolate synthase [Flavobacteriales bacterium]|nr:MAG: tetrahydrofolate synthase [Flavobacteriales bacterium]
MTYSETLDFLFSKLPMYQRIGSAAYKADLSNTIAICKALGNPQKQFKSVHIAGTNGKGSVAHILSSVLQKSGYKTGLYTSPHYKDFRERIKIDGKKIPKNEVVEFVDRHQSKFEKNEPSFFEWTVGLAFNYFVKEKVDIAILETGLGGRLDSTNVATPLVSVITNIGFDHMQFLGDTLKKIATEKAGIIKKNIPVVIGERQKAIEAVFTAKAKEKQSEIFFAADNNWPDYETDLAGSFQQKNIKTSLQTIEIIRKFEFNISEQNIVDGLANVSKNTGFQGRWQVLSNNPLTICDSGHNKEGLHEILTEISKIPHRKLHFVLGVVSDKNIHEILALLPTDATYYFCAAKIPRALAASELKAKAEKFALKGLVFKSVQSAFFAAKASASKKDLIFVGGSTFVVAETI